MLSSTSSLTSSAHLHPHQNGARASSQIAKTYRQAAQLFLTRRLPEALSTIEPVITPQSTPATVDEGNEYDNASSMELVVPAPITSASKGTRIKVWSFYLTFLNAVVELGPEEGKHAFGSTRWKALVAKAREGAVWDEVVNVGYHGIEADVDADVVINLATLLLTHMPSQYFNAAHLESYLAATSTPNFNIPASAFSPQPGSRSSFPPGSAARTPPARTPVAASGTTTPAGLHSRLKLLELYSLHVLPALEQWDAAREFIQMSDTLDDERKDAFILALHGLKAERETAREREDEVRRRQEEQWRRKEEEERRRQREEEEAEERRRVRREEEERRKRDKQQQQQQQRDRARQGQASLSPPHAAAAASPAKALYQRAAALCSALLLKPLNALATNPLAALRMVLFVLALALALGRRDVRERLRRAWEKVKSTVGVGVKVSYI
ncbi:hypothetical protein BDY21DRAFT_288017 [Lineolata rhizophorae]|uniref:Peroxin 26 n=1 Tax=Lineolata rhizophorae TaxID=578093 RepID=A0A6A6NYZ7_9PEZI|nr:hypothetical protein BDY21DRAFT_288017 [Lineolata rhizophorae]